MTMMTAMLAKKTSSVVLKSEIESLKKLRKSQPMCGVKVKCRRKPKKC